METPWIEALYMIRLSLSLGTLGKGLQMKKDSLNSSRLSCFSEEKFARNNSHVSAFLNSFEEFTFS